MLEPYLKGTYIMCPYLEYLKYREQDPIRQHPIRLPRYLITMRTHMQFLHMILLVN